MFNTRSLRTPLLVAALAVMILTAHSASAQGASNLQITAQGANKLEILTSNSKPQPNEIVTFTAQSYSTDLNRAIITWYVNGVVKKSGRGQTSFSTKVGDTGSATRVSVIVSPSGGLPLSQQLTLRPASVDIIWQSDSYTPPFYKGKALFPPQGIISFVAVAELGNNAASISPENLIYKWEKNGTPIANSSGYGKNTLTLARENADILGEAYTIAVEVSTVDNSVTGKGYLSVKPQPTGVLVYENSPLYGVLFNKALRSPTELSDEEISLTAYPYYYNKNDVALGKVHYSWLMNNARIPGTDDSQSVTLRHQGTDSGSSALRVAIQNSFNILQSAERSFLVNFGQKNTKSPF